MQACAGPSWARMAQFPLKVGVGEHPRAAVLEDSASGMRVVGWEDMCHGRKTNETLPCSGVSSGSVWGTGRMWGFSEGN